LPNPFPTANLWSLFFYVPGRFPSQMLDCIQFILVNFFQGGLFLVIPSSLPHQGFPFTRFFPSTIRSLTINSAGFWIRQELRSIDQVSPSDRKLLIPFARKSALPMITFLSHSWPPRHSLSKSIPSTVLFLFFFPQTFNCLFSLGMLCRIF